jgi:plasmid maintenance system antidote protein VapI
MNPVVHPGRLLKRELAARKLSTNRLSLDIGVPSGRITEILNCRRSITADTAVLQAAPHHGKTFQVRDAGIKLIPRRCETPRPR